jgi:hypothetical protein
VKGTFTFRLSGMLKGTFTFSNLKVNVPFTIALQFRVRDSSSWMSCGSRS